jgi:hypothetical protein
MSDQALSLNDPHVQQTLKETLDKLAALDTRHLGETLNRVQSEPLECGGHHCERISSDVDASIVQARFAEGQLEQPRQRRVDFEISLHQGADPSICCPKRRSRIAKVEQTIVTVQVNPSDGLSTTKVDTTIIELICMRPPSFNGETRKKSYPSRDDTVLYFLFASTVTLRQDGGNSSNSRSTSEETSGYICSQEKFDQVIKDFIRIASMPSC